MSFVGEPLGGSHDTSYDTCRIRALPKQRFPFRTLRIVLPWMCDREHNGKNSLLILFQKRKGSSPI